MENQREHFAAHRRAREYAKALLEDLEKDTMEIRDVIREDKFLLTCFDSIRATIQSAIKDKMVPGMFYVYCNTGTTSPTVVWNNATLTQISQSGNLRYFTNLELVKKISYYYSETVYISSLNQNDQRHRDKSMELRSRVLNNYYYSQYDLYHLLNASVIPDSLMRRRIPLQTMDANLINEFANSFESRKVAVLYILNGVYPDVLKEATELMRLLKKEYHLE